jgi:hypothetical protein
MRIRPSTLRYGNFLDEVSDAIHFKRDSLCTVQPYGLNSTCSHCNNARLAFPENPTIDWITTRQRRQVRLPS